MARLLHEIWHEDGPSGPLPTLCLAGPDGDHSRKSLGATARLVDTFEAGTNFEAMTIYYRHNGWGDYRIKDPMDQNPFPDSWAERQRAAL